MQQYHVASVTQTFLSPPLPEVIIGCGKLTVKSNHHSTKPAQLASVCVPLKSHQPPWRGVQEMTSRCVVLLRWARPCDFLRSAFHPFSLAVTLGSWFRLKLNQETLQLPAVTGLRTGPTLTPPPAPIQAVLPVKS